MSRCFPFPPPGYEKKPTTDEPDLLKKEKRKEKKHKKDKKDKEKKEGKEKKEKDRSEGKHKDKKEKKDKKDKHRDKKKDKEKSKTTTPDENRIHGQFEGCNGEKFHNNTEQNKEKIIPTEEKKSSIQFPNQNGDLARNRIKVADAENLKFVQELDRRFRDEEKGMGSHQFVVEARKNNFNKFELQKTDGRQAVMDVASIGGNVVVPNRINGATPPPSQPPPPPFENKVDKRIEKKQEKESDDKRGDKRKNKEREKHKHKKDKSTEKEKKEKKEEKVREKSELKKDERDKNKHVKKSDPVVNLNNLSTNPFETSFQGVGSEGNLKKRKDMEPNGVSHEIEPRPNKMARPVSNISPENGRKLVSIQNPNSSLLDKQGVSQGATLNSFKKGGQSQSQRVNGMIPSQPVAIPTKKPPISAFNHIPSKPAPIKSPSPPVITNHIAAQSPPVPTTKPPQPNHIPAQPPIPKPPPAIPNPTTAHNFHHHQPPPLSSPSPPPPITTAKQPVSRPKPPPAVVNKAVTAAVPPPPPPKKPPHPDTKYLNQILSVPKLDEWCGFDDQEWLFNNKTGRPVSKKPELHDQVQVQVWSEAKHIESVDVCALPYVIPY